MEEGVDCRWPMQPTLKECFRKLWNNFLFKFAIANKKFNTIIKILKNRRDLRHVYLKLSYFTFFNDSAFSQWKLFWHPLDLHPKNFDSYEKFITRVNYTNTFPQFYYNAAFGSYQSILVSWCSTIDQWYRLTLLATFWFYFVP